jgi:hypothetical protein
MSSVLKKFSQIPVRVKYLIGLGAAAAEKTGVGANGVSAFSLAPGEHINVESLALAADVTSAASYSGSVAVGAGKLFKDMGRQITVLDTDDATHLALYRQVQIVDGPTTEGVGGDESNGFNANIYLRVWAADGLNVVVARTG